MGGGESSTYGTATAASAEVVFDYDFAIKREEEENQDFVEEAYAIPDNANQNNYAGVSDDSRPVVKKAEQIGLYKKEQEMEAIRKGKQRIFSHHYNEVNSVKKANEVALQRDREGLQIQDDHISTSFTEGKSKLKSNTTATKNEEQQNGSSSAGTNNRCSGYQVEEYEI